MSVRILVARPRPGLVGETRRVTHVFPYPDTPPDRLAAYCGANFGQGELELLPGIHGMPCEACLARVPAPEQIGAP
ncbi:hypothetical protein [Prauserella endophytica]|uniref:DUF3039 domain-containing protein n=1 Tax=Prauserella endophytica TaxID=1592324 RepID=A0ABY2RXA4_9PSEU|nr:hypothetical protein [Prauserella endophytica]TKG63098.1 hypothetical protein FCN18_30470 [Prauserella endophytica]